MASHQAQESESILVIRLSSLGDILLTAPALRALRSRFPTARIDFLTSQPYTELVKALPGVDCVLEFDKSGGFKNLFRYQARLFRNRYSVLVDLQNSFRSAFWRTFSFPAIWSKSRRYRWRRFLLIHLRKNFYGGVLPIPQRYLAALESLGCKDDGRGLELNIPDDITSGIQERLQSLGIFREKAIVLCPGARHATKRWPSEKWVDLTRALLERDFQIVFLGGAEDKALIKSIEKEIWENRTYSFIELPLLDVAALTKSCRCFVSNDSGLMHMATAVRTPVVAIFGPTVEEFGFFPFRAVSKVIQKDLSCRPCSAMGTEKCPKVHFQCMLDISVTEVLEATLQLTGTNRTSTLPV